MITKMHGPIESRRYLGVAYGVESHHNQNGYVTYIARIGAASGWPAMSCRAMDRDAAHAAARRHIDNLHAAGLVRLSA